MIALIPALYYARKVHNGLLTNKLVLVWLSNKPTVLPTLDTYGLHLHRNSHGSRW